MMLLLETHLPEPDVDGVAVGPAVAAALGGAGTGVGGRRRRHRRAPGVAQADRRAGCRRVLRIRTRVGPGGTTSWRMPPLPPSSILSVDFEQYEISFFRIETKRPRQTNSPFTRYPDDTNTNHDDASRRAGRCQPLALESVRGILSSPLPFVHRQRAERRRQAQVLLD